MAELYNSKTFPALAPPVIAARDIIVRRGSSINESAFAWIMFCPINGGYLSLRNSSMASEQPDFIILKSDISKRQRSDISLS